MRLAVWVKHAFNAISGRGVDLDAWYEAEAAETRATLRHLGIHKLITANDIRDQTRWSAQSRREQLDIAMIAQAKREQLDIASLRQEDDE